MLPSRARTHASAVERRCCRRTDLMQSRDVEHPNTTHEHRLRERLKLVERSWRDVPVRVTFIASLRRIPERQADLASVLGKELDDSCRHDSASSARSVIGTGG